jgi:hypothetical protein
MIVLIGVVPGPFLARIRPAVAAIDGNLQRQRSVMSTISPTVPDMKQGTISARKGGSGSAPKSTKGSR